MSKPSYSTANSDAALAAYKEQLAKYEAALEKYEAQAQARAQAAEAEAKKYVGDAGYRRAVELGKEGAMAAAQGTKNTVESTARTSGMSRAQAAAMGANTMTDAYGSAFNQQQQAAYQSGTDAANSAYTAAGMQNQISGNALQGQQNMVQNRATQYDMGSNLDSTKNQIAKAKADRTMGWISTGLNAVGGVLQGLGGSDERMKDAQKIDYKKTRYKGRTKETKKKAGAEAELSARRARR